jgi:PAS domain S-box-containing protein
LRSKVELQRRNLRGGKAIRSVTREHSKRKPANLELKEEHSTLQGIINSSREPIFSVDQQYRYTCFNDAHASVMKAIYGKDIEIGGSLLDYMTVREDREKAKRNLDRALAGEGFVEAAYSGEEERSRRYFEVSHNPIQTNDGTITGVAVVAKDITERKMIEEQLTETEERYRSLFDRMLDGVYRSTHEGRFVEVNPAFVKMFGYSSRQEMLGIPNIGRALYFSPEERGSHIPQTAEKGVEVFPMRRKDGSMIWVEDHGGYVHDEHGRVAFHEGILRDVTERKRAEERLRESEEKFSRIFQFTPDSLAISRLEDGVYVEVNKAFTDNTGFGKEEVIGRSSLPGQLGMWVNSEDRDKFAKELRENGEVTEFEASIRMKDGSTKLVLLTARIIEIGGESYVLSLAHDVTERKRMEKELQRYSEHLEELVEERSQDLRSAKERLEYVIESNPAAVYLSKPLPDFTDFYSIYQSKSVASLTGFESEEFIGEKGVALWESRVHPEDLISYRAGIPEFWKKGHQVCEYRFLHKNGTYRWIREEVNLSRDPDGNVRDVIGYWSDVTERKRMEEDLRASMERLDFLITANPAAIFSGKPHSDLTDFDRTYFSRNLTSMLGYAPEDFINDQKFWERHVHPEDRQRVMDSLPRLFREGHVSNDYRFLHKDGTYRWIRGKARAIADATGKPMQVVGYWSDVTEEKRLEEALLKSERLAAIGGAAAMVGHDLRNPLQGMTGAIYVAKKLIEHPEAEGRKEVIELLDTLDSQVRYMDKIVSDLQSYAAPISPAPSETDMPELIKSVISYVRIPENVATEVTISKELKRAIVDPVLFRRVVTNLILNAVQAMPNGGNLTVSANKEQDSVTITVEDTGEGIPKENMDKLFNPFFTTKSKGQGLGLAVCRRLVEAQNGAITVKSELGKGSSFTASLPIRSTITREPTSER